MIPGCYSLFWLHCRRRDWLHFVETWRDRDGPDEVPAHPAEALDMRAWLRLPERERAAVVEGYAARAPRAAWLKGDAHA